MNSEINAWIRKEDYVLLFDLSSDIPTLVRDHQFNLGVANQRWIDARVDKNMCGRVWNGVSPGMWHSREWYDYLEAHGGREMVERYHPKAYLYIPYIDRYFCSSQKSRLTLYAFALRLLRTCGVLDSRSPIASWTFSYQGQFSSIADEFQHSDSDSKGPWCQLRFREDGRIQLAAINPSYRENGTLRFRLTVVDLSKPIQVYNTQQPSDPISLTCYGYNAIKAFFNIVRHDVLCAAVYLVDGDRARPLLAIRSLNHPLLWIPMAQGKEVHISTDVS